ncbi:MAG: hypothetical protein AB1704_20090 [Pseudomonadota bacterium]
MSLIIDAMLAMSIGAVAIVQADMQAVRTAQVNDAVETGQYMYGLQQGVNKYIAVNGNVLGGITSGSITNPVGTAITVANSDSPTIAELQANGFLPLGYSTNNPSNLTFSVNITPTDCPGVGCTLPATVTSSQYKVNGQVRNDLMAYAVTAAGLDGGQSLVGSPGQYTSYGATWTMANANGTAGQLMMRAGMLTTGYVDTLPFYMLNGSRPLTGPMNANGQNIGGVATMTANLAQVTTLDAGTANVSGNATVSGTTATNALTTNSATVYGNAQVNGNEVVYGSHTVNGQLSANNLLQLAPQGAAGGGCSGNSVTTDVNNGQLLSCQSGVWAAAGGRLSISTYSVPNNSTVSIGAHVYCATLDPGGLSWGQGQIGSFAGTNTFGSQLWNFSATSQGNNPVVFICLDQQT